MLATGAAAVAGCGGDRPELAGTNLLLVTVDTLRADHLGAWGSPHRDTPEMDRLAAEGTRFARALSPAPTTLPTHASILTGMSPPGHGIRDNSDGLLPESAVTLAELLRDRGYATGAFVGAYVLDARWGLDQGFDVYDDPEIPTGATVLRLQDAERSGEEVLAEALAWIETQKDAPWFAWIHFYDPHAPYRPPEPFAASHADRRYAGEIAYVDSLLTNLRTALEATGAWSRTSVILTSDHGEALGEHGEPTHGFFIYEESLHVPLLIRPADDAAAGSWAVGGVVGTPVALIDVFPTVAELWGLPSTEGMQGRSLAAALRGAEIENRPIYSETFVPRLHFGWQELYAVSDGAERFIEAPTPEYYDLGADPEEATNLAGAEAGRVAELRAWLEQWLADSRAAQDAASAGPASGTASASAAEIDPDRIAALRALGYLSASRAASGDARLPDPKDRIDIYNRTNAAMARWQGGDHEGALAQFDLILEDAPEFAGAHHFRGQILLSAGRTEEAMAAFRDALVVDPEHELAARELLRVHVARGELEEAEELLRELLTTSPAASGLRKQLGDLLLSSGRIDEAHAVFLAGLEIDPEAPRLIAGVGHVELLRGRPAEALVAFDRALLIAPTMAGLQAQRGLALTRLGRHADALAAFRAETEHDAASFVGWVNRGLSSARSGNADEAILSFRTALELRPESADAQLFLAEALVASNAEAYFDEAQRLAEAALPSIVDAGLRARGHLVLATIYETRGLPDEAAAHRREADKIRQGQ